ncbi:two-component sensor histidine kinase [Flavobacterium sp. PL11]|uniref:histidine kinase dimerization/phosphoacceptor domain -containing protein n=1 Tax=Flavobacterium sp. PL11 TaxID=3071717 RepID=UPI002DFF4669|nr:two-component sensor histidine kinase [Flavobacterium sp. PL11]
MMKYTKSCLVTIFLLGFTCAFSQNNRVDSVQQLVKAYELKNNGKQYTLKDSVKVKLLELLSDYTYNNQRGTSINYSKNAAALAAKIKFYNGVYTNTYNLGSNYSFSGDYLLSLNYLSQAAEAAKKLNSPSKMASVYNERGIVYSKMSNYSEAVRNALLALRYYEKSDNMQLYGNSLVNLGLLYKHQNKIELALTYYEKAIQAYQKLEGENATFSIAATYSNSAQAHLKAGHIDASIKALNQSQDYAAKINDTYLNAENNYALGMIYFNLKNYKSAEMQFLNALKGYNVMNDKSGVAKAKVRLGRTYFLQNQRNKGLQFNQEGLELAKKINHLEWQRDGYKDRADMLFQNNNYKEAYKNQALFKVINDSMFNANQEKKITELQMQYTFDKEQEKTKIVQFQKILNLNNEASRLRFIRNSAVILAGLFLTMFGVILFNFLKVKKQRKVIDLQQDELKLQNDRIQASLFEKEVLLKEIHHRVKNNLQIISSLLNIQAQNITDKNVLDSIKEGQSRVQAMSLIHQNLYQSQELDAINMEDYLRQLTIYLNEMYHNASEKIAIEVQAPQIYFDIDTAIPLGLIVNELVSNAFKYAFSDKNDKKITIRIESKNNTEHQLSVSDNGIGMPEDFTIENSKSMGLNLVSILSRQLKGSVSYHYNNGTRFEISFKQLETYNTRQK